MTKVRDAVQSSLVDKRIQNDSGLLEKIANMTSRQSLFSSLSKELPKGNIPNFVNSLASIDCNRNGAPAVTSILNENSWGNHFHAFSDARQSNEAELNGYEDNRFDRGKMVDTTHEHPKFYNSGFPQRIDHLASEIEKQEVANFLQRIALDRSTSEVPNILGILSNLSRTQEQSMQSNIMKQFQVEQKNEQLFQQLSQQKAEGTIYSPSFSQRIPTLSVDPRVHSNHFSHMKDSNSAQWNQTSKIANEKSILEKQLFSDSQYQHTDRAALATLATLSTLANGQDLKRKLFNIEENSSLSDRSMNVMTEDGDRRTNSQSSNPQNQSPEDKDTDQSSSSNGSMIKSRVKKRIRMQDSLSFATASTSSSSKTNSTNNSIVRSDIQCPLDKQAQTEIETQ